jgi:hypothetical protein
MALRKTAVLLTRRSTDLSCWGDFRRWPPNPVAVEQLQVFVKPLATPPLGARLILSGVSGTFRCVGDAMAQFEKKSNVRFAAMVAVATLLVSIAAVASANAQYRGTPEMQQACTPDVMRLCNIACRSYWRRPKTTYRRSIGNAVSSPKCNGAA